MDRFDLYELCVQSPAHLVPLLEAIHGADPEVLCEDFAGTAALSEAWVARHPRAIAIDLDEPTLFARPRPDTVERRVANVLDTEATRDAAGDVIFVGNFSIGEIHERRSLVAYLDACRARLRPGGVFVCDTYGGESAFMTGDVHRDHFTPDMARVRYTWEQREADPLTGRVINALHFRVDRAGMVEAEFPDAFVYDWRLWSVPELRDAMTEAGFASTEVHAKMPDAEDGDGNVYMSPVEAEDLDDSFIVLVASRVP